MKDNPYSKMLEIMKSQGKSYEGILIGEVISAPPTLVIKVGELQVDKDNILIADYLLSGYSRSVKVTNTSIAGSTTTNSSHSHDLASLNINKADMGYLDALKKGSRIAVATTPDKQTYIILARLVSV